MALDVTPRKLQREYDRGYERMRPARKSRYLFLRAYTGGYYNTTEWGDSEEPLNLIFNAIRILVPNLVTNYPKADVSTDIIMYRDYAKLLGLSIDSLAEEIRLKKTLRRWVMDSLFGLAIMKTGLCTNSASDIANEEHDPTLVLTQPYADTVDLDDFVLDATCRRLEEAVFTGNRITVDRESLLESGLYNNELIERLPSLQEIYESKRVSRLSQTSRSMNKLEQMRDPVQICEIWVPSRNTIFSIPGHKDAGADDFLREAEYYGMDEGPYTYLALAPDVPDNPLPVVPVSIWYDLHQRANEVMVKALDQASAQKDILLYKRGSEDDAESVATSNNLETLGLDDPEAIKAVSIGGPNPVNENFLASLMVMFSQMAGNIEQLAGQRSDADTATQANILQQNAAVAIEDMRDIVYDRTSDVLRRLGWYLHTDPLIQMPLIRRATGPDGMPVDETVVLTPEMRRGDFIDFAFKVGMKSMSRLDPQTRLQRMNQLMINVIPAIAQTAITLIPMGIPFDAQTAIIHAAEELELDWMADVFNDPRVLQRMMAMQMTGPQMQDSKGSLAGVRQNQGNPAARPVASQQTVQRQEAQAPVVDSQSQMKQGV